MFVPNQPLEDNFREERLQQDEEIVIPQDDLYTITWETNFGEQLTTRGNEPIPTSMPNGERPIVSDTNSTDACEDEADYIITTDSLNDVNDVAQIQNERMKNDVSKINEANEDEKNGNSDCRIRPFTTKIKKNLSQVSPKEKKRSQFVWKIFLLIITMHKTLQKRGMIFEKGVPEKSQSDDRTESLSPRGEKYNLRRNPNPNYSETSDTRED